MEAPRVQGEPCAFVLKKRIRIFNPHPSRVDSAGRCYAGIHKIAHPGEFVDILRGYNLFPAATLHPIAVFVPWLCGAALVFGIFPRGAAAMINLMLLVFITAISINCYSRTESIPIAIPITRSEAHPRH